MARTIGKAAVAVAMLAIAYPSPAAPRPAGPPRAAAVEQRAAVVVHTGSEVRTACVRFAEESISGKEALERANMQPVFRAYSGQGTAVCALCGKGCPADESCLTCGGSNYWAYHRARAGAGTYTPSQAGVSSTRVRDGDVEGWQWGPGTPPPMYSIDQVCPPAPPPGPAPADPPPQHEPPQHEAPPAQRPAASSPRPTPSTLAPVIAPSPTTLPPAETTTTALLAPVDTTHAPPVAADAREVAARPAADDNDGGGGSPASFGAFALLLAGLAGWAIWARRRRAG